MAYYWMEKKQWGKGKPPALWEAIVINDTLEKLELLTRQEEEEIEKLGAEVTRRFLERVKPVSVKNSFSRLHKAMRIHFSPESGRLNENNSYLHPTRSTREHIACLLIDTPEEIKAVNLGLQQQALDWKQHTVATLDNPEAIVAKGRELLEKAIAAQERGEFASYLDLSVALALLVGLRAGEILRDAVLEAKSDYTVMLTEGQAKTRGKPRIYEMPTLIEAGTILKGYQILRETFEARDLNDKELEPYKNKMRFHVIQNFSDLIPTLQRLSGERQVNLQRLRAVYDTIAVFYYCPPQLKDFVYIKAINGHEPTPGKNDAAMHYLDYQIADGVIARHSGQRQGIKLSEPGVKVIEAIADKLKQMKETSQGKQRKPAKQKTTLKATISPQIKKKFLRYQEEVQAATYGETLQKLIEKAHQAPTPVISSDITPEILGLTADWQGQLVEAMKESGEADFKTFALEALKKEIKFRIGLRSRHEGKDFTAIPLSELKRVRHTEACSERLRRAFLAIKHHNSAIATEKAQRWYINANTLHQLVGGRFATVTPWVEQHRDEIETHNQTYELMEADNRKPNKIDQIILVPEFPDE
jgi:hypothetical protein